MKLLASSTPRSFTRFRNGFLALLRWLAAVLPSGCLVIASAQKPELPPPEATEKWDPVVKVVQALVGQPPSDAIVLFDGSSTDAWTNSRPEATAWRIVDGAFVSAEGASNVRTKESFGDIQLHLEFRTPPVVSGTGQGRGNSGVQFMGRYELQILDSYDNRTYSNGQAASIYKQHIPLVNAARPPGDWQSFDVIFIAPRFSADGKLKSAGRMTAFHNGVLVQHDVEITGTTVYRGNPAYSPHQDKEPLELQFHKNAVGFRNIWVRKLALPENQTR